MRLLVRVILNAIAIMIAAFLVPGVVVTGALAALVAGLILGFINAIVRPILILLTLPVTLLTLGLFLFVVNAVCFGLTAALVPGFDISSAFSAFLGALVVTIVSWVLNALVMTESRKGGVATW
jgi:putative membrane protein